jgi:hypothetical protein
MWTNPATPGVELWSWGESNPRPLGGYRTCYDHSRLCRSTAAAPAGRLTCVSCRVFPRRQRSFSPSAVSPCGPSPLLLPGCEDQAPCAIAGHDDSLPPELDQAARANCSLAVHLVSPFYESETTRVARTASRSQRRNQSAPCVLGTPYREGPTRVPRVAGGSWCPTTTEVVDAEWGAGASLRRPPRTGRTFARNG